MPTATQSPSRKKTGRSAPQPVIEFTAAAHEHVEPAFDVSVTTSANDQTFGPFDVPAYGFLRHILLLVTTSGGTAGPGVLAADGPFALFSEVTLLDVNGAPLFGPYTGYQLFVANLFGGYAFRQDPTLDPDYSATVVGFAFALRIPVEILHNNGLGSLANQNAAAAYKVRIRVAPNTTIWSTQPTTPPTVRVRGFLEAWSQPNAVDLLGRPQATTPPRHGTSQYWTFNQKSASSGQNTLKVERVGNLVRNIVLVNRLAAGGARDSASFPDPIQINWDARQLTTEAIFIRRKYMSERTIFGTGGLPTGVYHFGFQHDTIGHNGDGTPELWIPTVQATRLEFFGSWSAACNVEFLVNDVAPVETSPNERFVSGSDTGFAPEVGTPVRSAA